MGIGAIWDLIILDPMVNVLIMLTNYLFDSLGLTIIVLTIIVNLLMYPLTQKQLKASKAMQEVQSKVAELRKKYARDRQKLAQEQMRLFKESGVSYAGCILPMLIQMPVWIVLYQSIIRVLAVAPEDFLNLFQRLYTSWSLVFTQLPLGHNFLWLNLATPDMFLALMVGVTMWVQQKMTTPPTVDPQQRAQSEMMQWMMPATFAILGLSFPSGLALYWVTSTGIRIAMQYFATGWGGLTISRTGKKVAPKKETKGRAAQQARELTAADISADIVIEPSSAKEGGTDAGKRGSKRQNGRGGYPARPGPTGRQPGGGRGSRRKRG